MTDIAESEVGYVESGPAIDRQSLTDVCDGLAEVLRVAARPPQRVSVRLGAASVEVEWTADGADVAATAAGVSPNAATEEPDPLAQAVLAPLVGTAYRAPEPGARPFVEVGDRVSSGQQVAIVEAMKLMNRVDAEITGTVVDVLVGDAEPVEYGQALILILPEEPV